MKRLKPMEVIILGAVGAFVIAIALPSVQRMRESTGRQRCPSNLRQIGTAMYLYSMKYGGAYPPSFKALASEEDLTPSVFICPAADAIAASSIAAFVGSPADCSYIYLGDRLNNKTDTDVILAFENPDDHDRDGVYVLCGDGGVSWLPIRTGRDGRASDQWKDVERQIANDARPVRIPPVTTQLSPP